MKKIVGFVFLICTLATCQDSHQSSVEPKLLRDVGREITQAEAQRWRGRYENNSAGARQQTAATISKLTLQKVCSAIADYDGVYFHHALENEKHHVIVIPYKDGQSLWSSGVVVDANPDSMVDNATASLWAERYVAEHPEGPWSHFFGRNMFDTILADKYLEQMEIVPAINDSGVHQLLLYVTYISSSTGRTKGTVEVYDHSNQCPPYCPDQSN